MRLSSLSPLTPTFMICPRCDRAETVPPGHGLRLPNDNPSWCHEVRHLKTGKVHKRGDDRG